MKHLSRPVITCFLSMLSLTLMSMAEQSFGAELTGQKLFELNCLRCHGANAKGSLEEAKTLKVDPEKLDLTRESVVQKPVQYLKQRIADGHGRMPQHRQKLTLSEIRSLVSYIQSLQKAYVLKLKKAK